MSTTLFSIGGVDVDYKMAALTGVGGGFIFLVTTILIIQWMRRRTREAKKPSVPSTDTFSEKGDEDFNFPDSDDDIILTEDEFFDEEAHARGQLSTTGTLIQRQLDLSTFAGSSYHTGASDHGSLYSEGTGGAFDLEKCLLFITDNLEHWKLNGNTSVDLPELDVEEFAAELEARWRLIDEEGVGAVTRDDLRAAVWNNDCESEGKPMPAGNLPEGLQAIVDDILAGVGLDEESAEECFDFWQFANYLLKDADGIDYGVVIPQPDKDWAYPCSE